LVGGAARSYTHSYPQVWITGGILEGLGSGSATSADQVATSHPLRGAANKYGELRTARTLRPSGRRPYHTVEWGRKALTYLDLGRGGP